MIKKTLKDTLVFIAQFTKNNGYPPTLREIADGFGITVGSVQDRIAILYRSNLVKFKPNKSRTLTIPKDVRTVFPDLP